MTIEESLQLEIDRNIYSRRRTPPKYGVFVSRKSVGSIARVCIATLTKAEAFEYHDVLGAIFGNAYYFGVRQLYNTGYRRDKVLDPHCNILQRGIKAGEAAWLIEEMRTSLAELLGGEDLVEFQRDDVSDEVLWDFLTS